MSVAGKKIKMRVCMQLLRLLRAQDFFFLAEILGSSWKYIKC